MLVCHLYIFSEESVQPFGPCFNWIVCFLIIELYKLFWYSLDNKYLSDMYFTDIFHKSVAYPQILLTVCFVQQTFLFQRNQTLNSFMDWSQFSSVAKSCPTLCDPMDCRTPGFPVQHQLPELAQTHVHRVCDGIQLSHPPLSPFPIAFNLSQHQGLFQSVSSSHQVTKVLEFQLHHQSFQ